MWKLKSNVDVFNIRDENGDIVAVVRKTFSFKGTKNARLIAAAPELLEACIKAHDALLSLHVCDLDKPFVAEIRGNLKSAIEKTEAAQ